MASNSYTPRELLELQRHATPTGVPMHVVTDGTMNETQLRAALESSRRDNQLLLERLRASESTVDAARDLANTAELAHRQAVRLLDQIRAETRSANAQLEDERRETARLRARVGELEQQVHQFCPVCKTLRPAETDWRSGMCVECFASGRVLS